MNKIFYYNIKTIPYYFLLNNTYSNLFIKIYDYYLPHANIFLTYNYIVTHIYIYIYTFMYIRIVFYLCDSKICAKGQPHSNSKTTCPTRIFDPTIYECDMCLHAVSCCQLFVHSTKKNILGVSLSFTMYILWVACAYMLFDGQNVKYRKYTLCNISICIFNCKVKITTIFL